MQNYKNFVLYKKRSTPPSQLFFIPPAIFKNFQPLQLSDIFKSSFYPPKAGVRNYGADAMDGLLNKQGEGVT